ncbi:MAG TPA: response regulator [Phycisphaerae bacterium]|nr:response regulator [Phycisphaerales bacterium]HRX86401.1 response regulator [Phycisphaerae bacterium]
MTTRTHPMILIAEDDAGTREALSLRLIQSGFDVLSAHDGTQAIKLLNENLVDGAILDVRIPGVDGFGVCEYIRDNDLKIPVFMLTGSSDGVVRNFLGKLTTTVGGDYFVTKPYDGKALALMLRRALEKPQRDA